MEERSMTLQEIYHSLPHKKVSSLRRILQMAKYNLPVPEVIYITRIIRDLSILPQLKKAGVRVIKMSPNVYRKFAILLHERGYRVPKIISAHIIQNPIEIPSWTIIVRTNIQAKKGRRSKLKRYERENIIKLAERGMSIKEIHDIYPFVSSETIRRIIKQGKITLKRGRPRIDKQIREAIINDYQTGKYTIRALARKYDISHQSVANILKESG